MLKNIGCNGLGMLMLALMVWIPFVHSQHHYPMTAFFQEWWTGVLALAALGAWLVGQCRREVVVPAIVVLPLSLLALVLLQYLLGKIIYLQQALLMMAYLLLASVLMIYGCYLRRQQLLQPLILMLSGALLLGAVMNTLFALQQHFEWQGVLRWVTVAKVSTSVFGNIAQSNHFASYLMWGLVSLGWMMQRRVLPAWTVWLLAVPMLFVLSLSGSRSSWLYLLAVLFISLVFYGSCRTLRPLFRFSVGLIVLFALLQLLMPWLPWLEQGSFGGHTVSQRLLDQLSGQSIRLHLWYESVVLWWQQPVLGHGIGQFGWQHFQLLPQMHEAGHIRGLYNHAHNILLQLAVETGLIGVLLLGVTLAGWCRSVWRQQVLLFRSNGTESSQLQRVSAVWWILSLLAVMLIHSMLEYPLWYAYFLAPVALLLGLLDERLIMVKMQRTAKACLLMLLLSGSVFLYTLMRDYQLVQSVMRPQIQQTQTDTQISASMQLMIQRRGLSVLTPYIDLFYASLIELNRDLLAEKLQLNHQVLRFSPSKTAAYRQVLLLALSEQPQQARAALRAAYASFPEGMPVFKVQFTRLQNKYPALSAGLLEFALKQEQEFKASGISQ